MFRYLHWLIILGVAAGCSQQAGDDQHPAPARELLAGQAAYEKVCAGCHEEGVDGAPVTGDREAWANRSTLWVAVLEEHAKSGYFGMPPKGGDRSLADEEVAAATAYMMSLTHPDRPAE